MERRRLVAKWLLGSVAYDCWQNARAIAHLLPAHGLQASRRGRGVSVSGCQMVAPACKCCMRWFGLDCTKRRFRLPWALHRLPNAIHPYQRQPETQSTQQKNRLAQHQTVLFFRLPTILVHAKGSLKVGIMKHHRGSLKTAQTILFRLPRPPALYTA